MKSLVIWGRDNSVNVQKVLWCCEEIGLPYQRIDAGGAHGVVGTAEYRALNPNGLVPTMDEDGFVLWESNALLGYIAAKADRADLAPATPRERADVDRWLHWQNAHFGPAIGALTRVLLMFLMTV